MDAKRKELGDLLIAKKNDVESIFWKRGIPGADIPDLVQEVFGRAFEHLSEHGVEGNGMALLRKIASDLARDYNDRARTRTKYAPKIVEEDLAPSNPERDLAQQEIHKKLNETIDAFPEDVRELLHDKIVEELTYEEIAKARRVSESTVKRRVADFLAECEEALRRKGVTSPLVVPFTSGENDVEGPGSSRDTTDPRLALVATVASPAVVPPEQTRSRWMVAVKGAACAAAGGFVVWLLMRAAIPAGHVSPVVHVSAPLFSSYAASASMPARLAPLPVEARPVCPEAPAVPPCSAARPPAAGLPEGDPSQRYTARACEAALDRGDKVEIQRWCSKVTGPFADALAARNAPSR